MPWTAGKVLNSVCRGGGKGTCEKDFDELEEDWLAKMNSRGEQLCMPVWCKTCREERRKTRYAMVMGLVLFRRKSKLDVNFASF